MTLMESLKENPITLFALARRFGHPEMADFTANVSLRNALADWPDSTLLDLITAHALLLVLSESCHVRFERLEYLDTVVRDLGLRMEESP